MMDEVDIQELKAFVMMADEGNFSSAAHALGITQPAISQRIAKLEKSLGFLLFTRNPSGAILTSCGERLLATARRCVASQELLLQQMDRHRHSSGGRVRIWIEPSLADEALLRKLGQLETKSGIGIDLVSERRPAHWPRLLKSLEWDLALLGSFMEQPVISGLERIDLFQEPGLSAVWSTERVPLRPDAVSLDDLLSVPLVIPSSTWVDGIGPFFNDWCLKVHRQQASAPLEIHSCQEAIRICQSTAKIAILPGNLTCHLHHLRSKTLTSKLLFGEVLPNAYSVGLFLRELEQSRVILDIAFKIKEIL